MSRKRKGTGTRMRPAAKGTAAAGNRAAGEAKAEPAAKAAVSAAADEAPERPAAEPAPAAEAPVAVPAPEKEAVPAPGPAGEGALAKPAGEAAPARDGAAPEDSDKEASAGDEPAAADADAAAGKAADEDTAGEEPAAEKQTEEETAGAEAAAGKVADEETAGEEPATEKQTEEETAGAEDAAGKAADEEAAGEKAADGEAPEGEPAAESAEDEETEEADGEELPLTPEEEAAEQERVAEMTRTVQVSLEQIIARMADAEQEDGDEAPEAEETQTDPAEAAAVRPEPSLGRRIGRAAGRGAFSIFRWLLVVVVFVALIAGAGIAYLYRSASASMLPTFKITLEGQTLQATAYDWHVPVVNDLLTRRYSAILSDEPTPLAETITEMHPELATFPNGYEYSLTLWNSKDEEVFNGTPMEFRDFGFADSGAYTGELVASRARDHFAGEATVSGSQTYRFSFNVTLRPSVRLDRTEAEQGQMVAVIATGLSLEETPKLQTKLPSAGFVRSKSGWMALLPLASDLEPDVYDIKVSTSVYEEALQLKVTEGDWEAIAVRGDALDWAYLGPDDTPQKVLKALDECDDEIHWGEEGFVLPYINAVDPVMTYGTMQVDYNEDKQYPVINLVSKGRFGEAVIAPANGRVVLARDLGGGDQLPNKTVVIEHGGGLKTVYYNLHTINVNEGDEVLQRQTIGESQMTLVLGAYVGRVAVDPLIIWRGQCNATKFY